MAFLSDMALLALRLPETPGMRPVGVAVGQGPSALEVAVLDAGSQPTAAALRAAWRARVAGRATPVLAVALYGGRASLCGPTGDQPPVHQGLPVERVEAICRAALAQPDRHSALRLLQNALESLGSEMPGIRIEGLLAAHALLAWGQERRDAGARGAAALRSRGHPLLRSLGYQVQPLEGPVSVLVAGARRMAVAVFLDRTESPDVASARFNNQPPASYALYRAGLENLDWVVSLQGSILRLYSADPTVGVGRRGRTETFVELNLDVLGPDQAGYLWDIFSADALAPGGAMSRLLEESARFGSELGARLRERVYKDAVPSLATALARARGLARPSQADLDETYQMALLMVFRVLFVAYAEDRDLLPYKTSDSYRSRSLKETARELAQAAERAMPFDAAHSHREETWRLFSAVNDGSSEWGVPRYNGGLFSGDPSVSPIGAALGGVSLGNRDFGPVLRDLLVDQDSDAYVPVDLRSLSVREFGAIYEGLLESELSLAETDLDVDQRGSYVRSRTGGEPAVRAGEVYIHNRSGSRKATGSYFTKDFAVEHLLDHSLEPALTGHLARLDALPEEDAGEAFFDFRVADIAMGSGHFLVAAVDRMEKRMADYLQRRPLPLVAAEVARLRARALEALREYGAEAEIEDTVLLRRQIARRCIYGVDLNPLAVELARVSLWVHTFVPGLPLSLPDHHLVRGNSLVGIATLAEAAEAAEPPAKARGAVTAGRSIFTLASDRLLAAGAELMARVGRLADADGAELARARQAWGEARAALAPTEALLDLLTASRLDAELRRAIEEGQASHWAEDPTALAGSGVHQRARESMAAIPPFHFPTAFPDVFHRDRPGFDVIIGNPPWEAATLHRLEFWARYAPGLRGLSQVGKEREADRLETERADLADVFSRQEAEAALLRRVLVTGPFPGMGTGDPDLYKAFCWRFLHLAARPGGRIGVVLPRSAWAAKGSEAFRRAVFMEARVADLTFLLNSGGWVFDDAEHRYTIALTALEATPPDGAATLPLRGPFRSLERFQSKGAPVRFPVAEALGWTDSAALPLLPTEESAGVFAQLRRAPRLDLDDSTGWRARPYRELDATNDKPLMTFASSPPKGYWPVFKGESFDIWENDHGPRSYYAWADPDVLLPALRERRTRAARNSRSPFSQMPRDWTSDPSTLPCLHPRLAFRDVTNRTNRRTVVAAMLPPRVAVTNTGPYFLWPQGDLMDQGFLLALLCSSRLIHHHRVKIRPRVPPSLPSLPFLGESPEASPWHPQGLPGTFPDSAIPTLPTPTTRVVARSLSGEYPGGYPHNTTGRCRPVGLPEVSLSVTKPQGHGL